MSMNKFGISLIEAAERIYSICEPYIEDIRFRFRQVYWAKRLSALGERTEIYDSINIWNPQYVSVGSDCTLNLGVYIVARSESKVLIKDHVRISAYAMITTVGLDYHSTSLPYPHIAAPIVINNGVWIGAHAIILPGVTIGERAVVAAGAVVTKDVKAHTLVAGVPAKEIGNLKSLAE